MNNERKAAEVEEITIGLWGTAWQRFMQENYPTEAEKLMNTARWEELALEIDREADSLSKCFIHSPFLPTAGTAIKADRTVKRRIAQNLRRRKASYRILRIAKLCVFRNQSVIKPTFLYTFCIVLRVVLNAFSAPFFIHSCIYALSAMIRANSLCIGASLSAVASPTASLKSP